MFFEKFHQELSRGKHCFILSTVIRIKENFLPDDIIGSLKTQLLCQVRCGDFQFAICGLDLVVDHWDVDIVVKNMRVGPEKVDDVHRKFRITENAKAGRTPKQLSEVLNRLQLFS